MLVAAVVDRLARHAELLGDVRDGPTTPDQIQNLVPKRRPVPPRHDTLLMDEELEFKQPDLEQHATQHSGVPRISHRQLVSPRKVEARGDSQSLGMNMLSDERCRGRASQAG